MITRDHAGIAQATAAARRLWPLVLAVHMILCAGAGIARADGAAPQRVIGIEGAYVNDSRDSGGATKYGITAATAAQHGISNVAAITTDTAFKIYISDYWDVLRLDDIAALSPALAEELFEQGVNMGNSRPAEWLQRILNTLNLNGNRFADVAPDGNIGQATIDALTAFFRWRGQRGGKILLNGLNAYQSTFYFDLAGRREKDEAFAYGWQANRVGDTTVSADELRSPEPVSRPTNPPSGLPPLYYITDSNGEMQGVWDKALPTGKPDGYIMEDGIKYPVFEYKAPKSPLVEKETLVDGVIHGGLLSIAAAGLSAAFGVDIGMTADTGAAVAAGGGIGSLLLFGAKQAAKFGAKLLAEKLAGKLS